MGIIKLPDSWRGILTMNRFLKSIVAAGAFVFFVASPITSIATPQTSFAARGQCEVGSFLGIPPWYRGLTKTDSNGDCVVKSPDEVGGLQPFIWTIVLNGIQIALTIAGWIALFFILYGGFLFITGGGNPSQVEKGRKSILNAIIGLVIALGSIAITNLIFGVISGANGSNGYGAPQIAAGQLVINGLNLLYYIAGIVAVIVIIIAGLNYVTALGNSSQITRAKNMILYAVIGLGVLLLAFAITNFVIERFI